MELIVFTNNGKTFIFNNVSNLKHETQGFSFTYTGKSTDVKREARFNYTSIAGYATNINGSN